MAKGEDIVSIKGFAYVFGFYLISISVIFGVLAFCFSMFGSAAKLPWENVVANIVGGAGSIVMVAAAFSLVITSGIIFIEYLRKKKILK